ncbi:hypothetical protein Taro_044173 [Colocasia esculenta]|uniref:Uncharacterized protein n=1 Tax=Colocasia esculenta TaxID=4460 RepID=A0A843WXM6_COLES|nr:hypothetical protein [Colocasia esculenta]
MSVVPATGTASPSTPVVPATRSASCPLASHFPSQSPPEVESHHPAADEEGPQLPGRQPCWISGGKIDPGSTSCYITTLVHAHIPGPVDSWKEFPPSLWELLFDMFTATGPWQERSQAAKRNGAAHPEKNVHTSGSVSYATHSQKLTHKPKATNDYVSESARTIAETYDKTMADRYAEDTPQPDLDPKAWVDAVGGPRRSRVYGFGDSLDTTSVLSSYASSVAPPAYTSSSAAPPGSGGEDMRTLIREELQLQFGVMVDQLITAIQGVGPSQQAPQVSITINFI